MPGPSDPSPRMNVERTVSDPYPKLNALSVVTTASTSVAGSTCAASELAASPPNPPLEPDDPDDPDEPPLLEPSGNSDDSVPHAIEIPSTTLTAVGATSDDVDKNRMPRFYGVDLVHVAS